MIFEARSAAGSHRSRSLADVAPPLLVLVTAVMSRAVAGTVPRRCRDGSTRRLRASRRAAPRGSRSAAAQGYHASRAATDPRHRKEDHVKIGIIGPGAMGGALARLWAAAGHEVMVSYSRSEDEAQGPRRGARTEVPRGAPPRRPRASATSSSSRCHGGSCPQAIAATNGALEGKVLIDVTNPLKAGLLRPRCRHRRLRRRDRRSA